MTDGIVVFSALPSHRSMQGLVSTRSIALLPSKATSFASSLD